MSLKEQILSNKCTLIGYDTISESTVYEIIDSLPNKIIFNVSYTTKSLLRELKINKLISNNLDTIIVVDLMYLDMSDTRIDRIDKFLKELNSYLYSLSDVDCEFKTKLIILTQINASAPSLSEIDNIYYRGGNSALHMANYAVLFKNKALNVIKNRYENY